MHEDFFQDFLSSSDTLRIYDKSKFVFSSTRDRLTPLMEYLETDAVKHQQVVILDKIMGNAAALLSVKAKCREVLSPLGSQFAIQTLDKFRIKHRLLKVVPHITRPDGSDWCPMEKLSLGKTSEEFYQALRKMTPAKTEC